MANVFRFPGQYYDDESGLHYGYRRYHNPGSLADACLVRMTELHDGSAVMTFDGGFSVYRSRGRRVIPLLQPQE